MEHLPQELRTVSRYPGPLCRCLIAVLLGLAASTTGCVGTEWTVAKKDAIPTGNVCQIAATWNHQIAYSADPARGGTMSPGLAGRLYLFGPEISHPMAGDGSVSIELYDDTPKATDGSSVLIECWNLDKDTLRLLLRKDTIGWGYTLFLPWGTYRADIPQVHLKVKYIPAKGVPLYAESSSVTLTSSGGKAIGPMITKSNRTVKPKSGPEQTELVKAKGEPTAVPSARP